MSRWLITAAAAACWLILAGFDLSIHSVPPEQILGGGPPKDGIPAIDAPRFVRAYEATFLADDDRVIGVVVAGEARAYPIRILNWHEIVNDDIAGKPVAVTWCPLTRTALVYDRQIDGRADTFGVSGKLYQSNLLMFDRTSESLWSQIGAAAVTGSRNGRRLVQLPSIETTWASWRRRHPATLVLSPSTGASRDYDLDPYSGYQARQRMMFPVTPDDRRLAPKEMVVGIAQGGESLAIPFRLLKMRAEPVALKLAGYQFTVRFDAAGESAEVLRDGRPYPAYTGYWFAWAAFHPGTALWGNAGPDPEAQAQEGLERLLNMMP
jgi:hypothetical protein